MGLDPNDPRPPYQQVANSLRAAILTRTFQPGEKLPSGPQLAERYGVARMTVQQAIRLLRDEGLVVSRQGSGVFVRERTERPVGLRPHLERAFEAAHVSVDFAGFSGETLHGAISEPIDKIRAGRLRPASVSVRLLVPDPSVPWSLPARVEDMADSPAFRARAEVRVQPAVPLFKLYVINEAEAFFGYYPVDKHDVQLDGERVPVWDLLGKDAVLFHHAADGDPESIGAQYVRQSRMWFDSLWNTVARPLAP